MTQIDIVSNGVLGTETVTQFKASAGAPSVFSFATDASIVRNGQTLTFRKGAVYAISADVLAALAAAGIVPTAVTA